MRRDIVIVALWLLWAWVLYNVFVAPAPCQNLAGANVLITPRSAAAGDTGRLLLYELGANGENMVGLKAPDALAADTVYVLPTAFPASNSLLQSTSAGIMSWLSTGGAAMGSCTTAGSICFSDGTTLQQDNANLFWDNALKRVGIGTNSPSTLVDIRAASGAALNYTISPSGVTVKYRLGNPYNVAATSTPAYVLSANAALDSIGSGTRDDTTPGAVAIILDAPNTKISLVRTPAGGTNPSAFALSVVVDFLGRLGIGGPPLITSTGTLHAAGDHSRPFDVAHTPASSTEGCNTGEIAFDGSFLYVCKAANSWARATLNAF